MKNSKATIFLFGVLVGVLLFGAGIIVMDKVFRYSKGEVVQADVDICYNGEPSWDRKLCVITGFYGNRRVYCVKPILENGALGKEQRVIFVYEHNLLKEDK